MSLVRSIMAQVTVEKVRSTCCELLRLDNQAVILFFR